MVVWFPQSCGIEASQQQDIYTSVGSWTMTTTNHNQKNKNQQTNQPTNQQDQKIKDQRSNKRNKKYQTTRTRKKRTRKFPRFPRVSFALICGFVGIFPSKLGDLTFVHLFHVNPLALHLVAPRLASAFARARLMLKRCKNQTAKMPSISKKPVEYNHPRCVRLHYFSKVSWRLKSLLRLFFQVYIVQYSN